MSLQPSKIDRPRNETDFEDWCTTIFRRALNCPGLERFGRRGQGQGGIDLAGNTDSGDRVSVQCKLRNDSRLKTTDIDKDISSATRRFPKLRLLVFATTHARDGDIQDHVLEKDSANLKRHRFRIEIWFWETLEEYLHANPDLRAKLCGGVSGEDARGIRRELREIRRLLPPQSAGRDVAPGGSRNSPVNRAITKAFSYIKKGLPDVALTRLALIQEEQGRRLTPRVRYRLLATIGNAYYAKHDLDTAATYYLKASRLRKTAEALWFAARAWMYKGHTQRARAITDRLLRRHPQYHRAFALRVQLSSDEYSVVLRDIPAGAQKDAEVALALGYSASDVRNFDDAERHCRVALRRHPKWAIAKINLASTLLMHARSSGSLGADGFLLVRDTTRVREAHLLLSAVLADKIALLDPEVRRMAFYNRSTALKLLGRTEDAMEDLEAAIATVPTDRQVVATYAISLDILGDHNAAIRQLRKAVALPGDSAGPDIILASMLEKQGTPSALAEAIAVLERARARAGKADRAERFEFARYLVYLRMKINRPRYTVNRLPSSDVQGWLPAVSRTLLKVWTLSELNAKADAMALLRSVAETTFSSLTEPELIFLGVLYLRFSLAAEAMRLLETRASRTEWTEITRLYVAAAEARGDDATLVDWCASLRQRGAGERRLVALEVGICIKYEDRKRAIRVLREWLSSHSGDTDAWIWLGNAAIDAGDSKAAGEAYKHLPSPESTEPDQIDSAIRLIFRHTTVSPEDKVRFAYRLWRRHRDDWRAWRALVLTVIAPGSLEPQFPEPVKVSTGVAVVLELLDGRPSCLVAIEGGAHPDTKWDEYPPSHALSRALEGRSAGDQVVDLPGLGGVSARVFKLIPIELAAASKCCELWERTFPGTPFVREFAIPPVPTNAPPEAVRAALRPMLEQAAQHRQRQDAILAQYRQRLCPNWLLSRQLGISQLQNLEALLNSDRVSLRCNANPGQDLARQRARLQTDKAIVLDTSALVVLTRLQMLENVLTARRTSVPQRMVDEIESVIHLEGNEERSAGMMTGAEPPFIPADVVGIRAWRKIWEDALAVLRKHASIESGKHLLDMPLEMRLRLMGTGIGPVDARSAAIAKASGLIVITDDLANAIVCERVVGVERACTYALLEQLRERAVLTGDAITTAVSRMIGWDLIGLPLSAQVIVSAMGLSDWDLNRQPARQAVGVFGMPRFPAKQVPKLLGEVIALMWRRVPMQVGVQAVLSGLLGLLDRRGDGRTLGVQLHDGLRKAFGVDVLGADGARLVVATWLAS